VRVGDVAARHDLREDGAEGVEALAAEPLAVAELQVTRADVIGNRESEDVIDRVVAVDAAAVAPITAASSVSPSTWVDAGGRTIGSPGPTSVFGNLPNSSGCAGIAIPLSSAWS
jgi:hypothetical protein